MIEEYVLRTVGPDLYIVGKELRPGGVPWHAAASTRSRGILWPWNACTVARCWACMEFLENDLGVRWLWPGELGTYVPRQSTVVLAARERIGQTAAGLSQPGGLGPAADLSDRLVLRPAEVRADYRVGGLSKEIVRQLVFPTEEAGYTYGRAVEIFNRRHRRVTQIEAPRAVLGSHVIAGITDWWAQFSKVHPDWFRAAGGWETRAQGAAGRRVDTAVCLQSRDAPLSWSRRPGTAATS